MSVIYLLIPMSVVLLIAGIWGLVWAVRSNQFDDLEGPAHQIVMQDREERRQRQKDHAE